MNTVARSGERRARATGHSAGAISDAPGGSGGTGTKEQEGADGRGRINTTMVFRRGN
jgi:hypothetical protein